jgi:hypothetical protein
MDLQTVILGGFGIVAVILFFKNNMKSHMFGNSVTTKNGAMITMHPDTLLHREADLYVRQMKGSDAATEELFKLYDVGMITQPSSV